MKAKELRIIITVDNLEKIIEFYRDTFGMGTSKEWHEETGNGIILDAGRASLELIDKKHAERIDEIEVGRRVSGPIRLALNVGNNIELTVGEVVRAGGKSVAGPVEAPWGTKVARVQAPDGMQITLFEKSTLFGSDSE